MGYVALYRKFRPQQFDELVGQEHIVRTLVNQLESGRIAHAYLFAGPRGTGKTSTAKLFARAINCANAIDGNPCGECDACKANTAEDNMDIIEIDAASNNGVDNIRDIREKVVFAPAFGKYKVYIIDEVHMLSGGAFNALLKTLEEPPKHVVFILATTEIHKLPATILSRCQRFDFKLISANVIFDRLKYVLAQVGASFEDGAIELIAKSASGGMRDALSLADVCLSYCGERVTRQDAMNVLGISDRRAVSSFADALISGDAAKALEACHELEKEGKDIGVFAGELMAHMRDIMLCKYSPNSEELENLPQEVLDKLSAQAKNASGERILRGLEILSRIESEIKVHSRPEIQFETAVVRICSPNFEDDIEALVDRISVLEQKLAGGVIATAKAEPKEEKPKEEAPKARLSDLPPWEDVPAPDFETDAPKQNRVEERSAPVREEKPAARETKPAAREQKPAQAGASSGLWQELLAKIRPNDPPLYMMIRGLDGLEEGSKFVVYVPDALQNKEAIVTKNAGTLSNYLKELTGKEYTVSAVRGTKPKNQEQNEDNEKLKAALDLFS